MRSGVVLDGAQRSGGDLPGAAQLAGGGAGIGTRDRRRPGPGPGRRAASPLTEWGPGNPRAPRPGGPPRPGVVRGLVDGALRTVPGTPAGAQRMPSSLRLVALRQKVSRVTAGQSLGSSGPRFPRPENGHREPRVRPPDRSVFPPPPALRTASGT